METLLHNIKVIDDRIAKACLEANRKREDVKLLLATKTVSPDRIKIALNAGYTLIAENKIQELKDKYEALSNTHHINHFIGHLQSNKIKELLCCDVQCLHSLDRIELAEKLNQRLAQENKILNVLIQVNTSGEESKFGIAPEGAIELIREVANLKHLQIKGLMTIGIFSSEAEKVRKCFQLLRSIKDEVVGLSIPNVSMEELSMGMSNDLEIAIAEGATIIRVGTAIFGERIYADSYYWNENSKVI